MKKKSGFPWVETLVVGVGGLAVVKIFMQNRAQGPTDLPIDVRAPGRGLPLHGPAYEGWMNTIAGWDALFNDGTIKSAEYKTRLRQTRTAVDEDYRAGRLTSSDFSSLDVELAARGG